MRQIAARVDDDLFEMIEKARGDVPRERWIRAAMTAFAGGAELLPPARRSALGTTAQGRQPKVSHPKPAKALIAPPVGATRQELAMARQMKLNADKYGKR